MQRRILAVLLALLTMSALIVALPGSAAAGSRSRTTLLEARLSGANEVPPADPDGTGNAVVALQRDQVCFALSWRNIGAPFFAHIHRGAAGVNGPIVVGFFMEAQPLSPIITSAAGCVDADPAIVAEIRRNPAGFYVNIHNPEFPAGVVRGQLRGGRNLDLDLGLDLRGRTLVSLLLGRNEVPPADPDGFGASVVSINGDQVCFVVSWANIATPTMAHIHRGARGVNGPIVVDFFLSPVAPSFSAVGGCNTGRDPAVAQEIARNPRGFYVNVHNADFPGGAIRGQLFG